MRRVRHGLGVRAGAASCWPAAQPAAGTSASWRGCFQMELPLPGLPPSHARACPLRPLPARLRFLVASVQTAKSALKVCEQLGKNGVSQGKQCLLLDGTMPGAGGADGLHQCCPDLPLKEP